MVLSKKDDIKRVGRRWSERGEREKGAPNRKRSKREGFRKRGKKHGP